jgi:hypothetical protein
MISSVPVACVHVPEQFVSSVAPKVRVAAEKSPLSSRVTVPETPSPRVADAVVVRFSLQPPVVPGLMH